jgi:hypothetical protein
VLINMQIEELIKGVEAEAEATAAKGEVQGGVLPKLKSEVAAVSALVKSFEGREYLVRAAPNPAVNRTVISTSVAVDILYYFHATIYICVEAVAIWVRSCKAFDSSI